MCHCNFDLLFPDDEWCWAPSQVPVGYMNVFFGKTSIQIFCRFFNGLFEILLLSCMSSLYVFNINPVSDIWFANIFSHSIPFIFICWWFPLLCRRFLGWYTPTCLFLLFFAFAFCVKSKKSLPRPVSRSLLPMFCSGS